MDLISNSWTTIIGFLETGLGVFVSVSVGAAIIGYSVIRSQPVKTNVELAPNDNQGEAAGKTDLRSSLPKLGDFGRVSFSTLVQLPPWPKDVASKREFVAIAVRFTFTVTTDKPKIRVTATRKRNVKWELDPSLVDEHAWYVAVDDRVWHERDTVDISLAFVGKDMHNHGFTGDWATPPTIVQNNQYLFLVEILSAEKSESLQVYLNIPSLSDGPQLSHPHIYNGNLLYLQDERYSPFTDGRFDLSSNDAPMVRAGGGWGSAPWGT